MKPSDFKGNFKQINEFKSFQMQNNQPCYANWL